MVWCEKWRIFWLHWDWKRLDETLPKNQSIFSNFNKKRIYFWCYPVFEISWKLAPSITEFYSYLQNGLSSEIKPKIFEIRKIKLIFCEVFIQSFWVPPNSTFSHSLSSDHVLQTWPKNYTFRPNTEQVWIQ